MSGPRYPAILPENLSPEQRVFCDEMKEKMKNGLGSTLVSISFEHPLTGAERVVVSKYKEIMVSY
jgi:hypothetical protein